MPDQIDKLLIGLGLDTSELDGDIAKAQKKINTIDGAPNTNRINDIKKTEQEIVKITGDSGARAGKAFGTGLSNGVKKSLTLLEDVLRTFFRLPWLADIVKTFRGVEDANKALARDAASQGVSQGVAESATSKVAERVLPSAIGAGAGAAVGTAAAPAALNATQKAFEILSKSGLVKTSPEELAAHIATNEKQFSDALIERNKRSISKWYKDLRAKMASNATGNKLARALGVKEQSASPLTELSEGIKNFPLQTSIKDNVGDIFKPIGEALSKIGKNISKNAKLVSSEMLTVAKDSFPNVAKFISPGLKKLSLGFNAIGSKLGVLGSSLLKLAGTAGTISKNVLSLIPRLLGAALAPVAAVIGGLIAPLAIFGIAGRARNKSRTEDVKSMGSSDLVDEINGIKDPVEKTKRILAEFGADGQKKFRELTVAVKKFKEEFANDAEIRRFGETSSVVWDAMSSAASKAWHGIMTGAAVAFNYLASLSGQDVDQELADLVATSAAEAERVEKNLDIARKAAIAKQEFVQSMANKTIEADRSVMSSEDLLLSYERENYILNENIDALKKSGKEMDKLYTLELARVDVNKTIKSLKKDIAKADEEAAAKKFASDRKEMENANAIKSIEDEIGILLKKKADKQKESNDKVLAMEDNLAVEINASRLAGSMVDKVEKVKNIEIQIANIRKNSGKDQVEIDTKLLELATEKKALEKSIADDKRREKELTTGIANAETNLKDRNAPKLSDFLDPNFNGVNKQGQSNLGSDAAAFLNSRNQMDIDKELGIGDGTRKLSTRTLSTREINRGRPVVSDELTGEANTKAAREVTNAESWAQKLRMQGLSGKANEMQAYADSIRKKMGALTSAEQDPTKVMRDQLDAAKETLELFKSGQAKVKMPNSK
jgi:hypothetical protein